LEFFSERHAKVKEVAEQVLAAGKHPLYDAIPEITPHSAMMTPRICERCAQLDAALVLIEDQTAVLLFPSTDALRGFAMQGKSSRESDPIVEVNDKIVPMLAVGQRDVISSLISNFRSGAEVNGERADNRMSNHWHYKTTDNNTPGQKELARLIDHA
jgi:hypothetical protein